MGLFSEIFGFNLFGQTQHDSQHSAYIAQLKAMLEKNKRDEAIKKKFDEDLKKQREKMKGRVIEGDFEVIEESKQLEGDSNA